MRNLKLFGAIAGMLLSYSSLSASSCDCECDFDNLLPHEKLNISSTSPFYEDWSQGVLPSKWYLYRKVFGSGNNGVVPELVNIEQDVVNGVTKNVVTLTAQGDQTTSTILGVKRVDGQFVPADSAQRVGAAITTADYFASGVYEVKMKIGSPNNAPLTAPAGLSPALFTFHYEEHYPSRSDKAGTKLNLQDVQYQPLIKQGNRTSGYYSTVNSEIDWPEFGKNGDFNTAAYTAWTSEVVSTTQDADLSQYGINVLDGNYHTYRMVWQTELIPTTLVDSQVRSQGAYFYAFNSSTSPLQGYAVVKNFGIWYMYAGKSATFYVDGYQVGQITQNVPPVSARLTVLAWLPFWAGPANWDQTKVYISEVSITPSADIGDVLLQPESFPTDGLVPPPPRLYN